MARAGIRAWTVLVHRAWRRPGTVFTQGLAVAYGDLWESSGLYGASRLRRLGPDPGRLRWSEALPSVFFGEGLCRAPAGMWQLTWREGVALQWDLVRRRLRAEVDYDREGWGACHTPLGVVTSDGSDELVLRDPASLRERGTLAVRAAGRPVFGLNDLEWAHGRLWANLYGRDCYLGIDSATGAVTDLVDGRALRARAGTGMDVLNGLAHDPAADHFYATGKCWPLLFALSFTEADFDPLDRFELPSSPTLRMVDPDT